MNSEELKAKLRQVRDNMSNDHATRLHRAVSWFRCAERYSADDDICFITLWIALNSCYAIKQNEQHEQHEQHEQYKRYKERSEFKKFADILVQLDADADIYNCLWNNYSGFVRLLINNQYIFPPFWKSQIDGNEDWVRKFDGSKKQAIKALENSEVSVLLSIVFDRLYVLRNQLIHGGATYESKVNRDQVENGKRLLLEILPIIVTLMFDETQNWGSIDFPVVPS